MSLSFEACKVEISFTKVYAAGRALKPMIGPQSCDHQKVYRAYQTAYSALNQEALTLPLTLHNLLQHLHSSFAAFLYYNYVERTRVPSLLWYVYSLLLRVFVQAFPTNMTILHTKHILT